MKRKLQEEDPQLPSSDDEDDDEALLPPAKRINALEAPSNMTIRPAIWALPFKNDIPYIPVTREEALKGKKVRIYADGVFDLFHYGHSRVLMQAKSAFPNVDLVVGVSNDSMTWRLKGKTVMNEEERYDSVGHCRYVDQILRDPPWIITMDFLNEYHLDFVAHDDVPYISNGKTDIYKEVKESGQFITTSRTEGISTSDMIVRIVKDYDLYLKRNMSRGYTAEQLNVGFVKRQEVKFRDKVDSMRKKSQNMIIGFMTLFGRDGRINEFFSDQKRKLSVALLPQQQLELPSPIRNAGTLGGPDLPDARNNSSSDEAFEELNSTEN